MSEAEMVWEGPEFLRPHLVPIDSIVDSEDNARKGDVMGIAGSIRVHGQKAFVIVTMDDPPRIVAGHHRRAAAKELGFTHIAIQPTEFADDDERRAYMIADNQLSDLAGYHEQKQIDQLNFLDELASQGKLEGTGYTVDMIEDQRAKIGAVLSTEAPETWAGGWSESAEAAQARAEALGQGHARKEIILSVTPDDYERYGDAMRKLKSEYGTTGVIDTTLRAVFTAADMLPVEGEAVPDEPEAKVIDTAAGPVEIHEDQLVIE